MNEQNSGGNSAANKFGSQMRITKDERDLIKATYRDNQPLLLLLRKIFLPEVDPTAPIGQTIDLWMTVKSEGLSLEEQLINLKARNQLITHVDQQLMTLFLIANAADNTKESVVATAKKNSSK